MTKTVGPSGESISSQDSPTKGSEAGEEIVSNTEAELGSPKTFWRSIKQLNISQTKKKCNLMEVLDLEGNIRCNEEAMDVWCNHFSRLLEGVDESSCGEGGNGVEESTHGKQDSLDFSDCLCASGSQQKKCNGHWKE